MGKKVVKPMTTKKRIIVGISGASGAILGVELLRALKLLMILKFTL